MSRRRCRRARSTPPIWTQAWSRASTATTPQPRPNEHRIVIAAETQVVSPDFGHLEPIVTAARRELAGIGITDRPKVVVADSGPRTTPRPGWSKGIYAFMRSVLQTEHGKALYKQGST
jgi:hypothetical protein